MRRAPVFALDDAVKRMREIIGVTVDWQILTYYLPNDWMDKPERRKSALASHFSAVLELVKQGDAEIRQDDTFGPISLRAARGETDPPAARSRPLLHCAHNLRRATAARRR